MSSRVLLGSGRIGLEEVGAVALRHVPLVLDDVALTAVRRNGAKLVATNDWVGADGLLAFENTADYRPLELLEEALVRSILFVRIARLLQGKSVVRVELVEFLTALLNNRIVIDIPRDVDDHRILVYMAAAFIGAGYCTVGHRHLPLSDALQEAGIAAPQLLRAELHVAMESTTPTAGVGSLCAYTAETLLANADMIGAMTCEALQASSVPFMEDHLEDTRPYRGQAVSASNVRAMLIDSKLMNARRSESADVESLRALPQYHGAVRDAFETLRSHILIELNSAAPAMVMTSNQLPSRKSPGPFNALPLSLVLGPAMDALVVLARGVVCRVEQLAGQATAYQLPDKLLRPSGSTEEQEETVGFKGPLRAMRGDLTTLISNATDFANKMLVVRTESALKDMATNSLQSAMAVYGMLTSVHHMLCIEALAAMQALELREQTEEVRRVDQESSASAAAAAASAASAAAAAPRRKGPQPSFVLGTGTRMARDALRSVFTEVRDDSQLKQQLEHLVELIDFRSDTQRAFLAKLFSGAQSQRRAPKLAKGTRDFLPYQMTIREKAFQIITNVFKRHGAVTIDTPVFELKDTLMGKYGDDQKLIFDLADQGGELLSLRYDLTVPFARYLAMNSIGNIKRYHISRVYRRDQPVMTRGRYREFYQCDFDIAGDYSPMMPDAEVLRVLVEILTELPHLGAFHVKFNHRKLLDACLAMCGVPDEKFRAICSSIDKLDKEPWSKVRDEMVNDKGLSAESADKIGKIVCMRGTTHGLLTEIMAHEELMQLQATREAVEDLKLLFSYLDALNVTEHILFDLSLARGLDYYTGVIYEAVLGPRPSTTINEAFNETAAVAPAAAAPAAKPGKGRGSKAAAAAAAAAVEESSDENPQVGSIAAGGRYDNLVGIFNRNKSIPAVGVSIGIERVFAIMERHVEKSAVKVNEVEVLVATVGGDFTLERFALCSALWGKGIKAEMLHTAKPRIDKQLKHALESHIPFMLVLGEDELRDGMVVFKDMTADSRVDVRVPRVEIVGMLQDRVEAYRASVVDRSGVVEALKSLGLGK